MNEVQETKRVWLAIGNTDCTEGRGRPLIRFVCESEATARRLGKKGSVQGSDCDTQESIALRVDNRWLVPGYIESCTESDIKMQDAINKRSILMDRVRKAGITEDEMKQLGIK